MNDSTTRGALHYADPNADEPMCLYYTFEGKPYFERNAIGESITSYENEVTCAACKAYVAENPDD